MSEDYLITPIIVNEKMEVVDGQHRLEAQKELDLPTYYTINNGYRLSHTQRLNMGSENWGTLDFLEGYCSIGLEDYMIYRYFYNKYGLNHQNAWSLLTGLTDSEGKNIYSSFKEGTFKVTTLDFAESCADKLISLKQYYDGYRRRNFACAMIRCFRNPEFSFMRFEKKLKYLSVRLVDCTTTNEYLALIEDIYNYKVSEKNKIRLY
jgi:hypothetical protein